MMVVVVLVNVTLISLEIPGRESLRDVIVNYGSIDNFDKRFPVNAPPNLIYCINLLMIIDD